MRFCHHSINEYPDSSGFRQGTVTERNTTFTIFRSILTSPETAAVAVAIAGIILPAMRFVLNLSAGSMLYILARKFDAAVMKSTCPLLSSSFSKAMGFISKSSVCGRKAKKWLLEKQRCPKLKLQAIRTSTDIFHVLELGTQLIIVLAFPC